MMNARRLGDSDPSIAETSSQRLARLTRERELLEAARAEFQVGLALDEAEVEAWLDALDSDEVHPLPRHRTSPSKG